MKHFHTDLSRLQPINLPAVFTLHVCEIMQASFFFIVILNDGLCVTDRSTIPRQLTVPLEDRNVLFSCQPSLIQCLG